MAQQQTLGRLEGQVCYVPFLAVGSLSAGEYNQAKAMDSSCGVTLLSKCLGQSQCLLVVCVLPLRHRLSHR